MQQRTHRQIIGYYPRRLQRLYVRVKLASDPVYTAAAGILTESALPLLDIGCGMGLLGQYLAANGHSSPYLGLDHDARKIDAGREAARRASLEQQIVLQHADVAELPPTQGHVAVLDVLHYLPACRQLMLLQQAATRVAPGGNLIIRNVLREPNWRFHATRVEEYFLAASGWIPGGAQHYPSADELRAPLSDAGLTVHIEPLRGHTPYNSYLIVARRPG